jgi:hypothetical protein
MVLYGSITFPDTLQSPVFTSRNDRTHGEDIVGVSGETDSNGNPSLHKASQALWIYYVTTDTLVQSAIFRWADRGLQYDMNSGVNKTHTVKNTHFEKFPSGTTAIHRNLPSGSIVLNNVTKGGVLGSDFGGTGTTVGSMANSLFYTDTGSLGVRFREYPDTSPRDLEFVPDPQGAAGPNDRFLTIVNNRVLISKKSDGTRLESAPVGSFFQAGSNQVYDPRAFYDFHGNRWIVCTFDNTTRSIRIAVSKGTDPTGLTGTTNWDRFSQYIGEPDPQGFTYTYHMPTMGIDANGLYIATKLGNHVYGPTIQYWLHKITVMRRKSDGGLEFLPAPNNVPINFHAQVGYPMMWVQPAINFDTLPSDAWFIGKGDFGSTHGPLVYARLQWNADKSAVSFVGGNDFSGSFTIPESYFDLDRYKYGASPLFPMPQPLYGNAFEIDWTGSFFQTAFIRSGFLWACHFFGLDGPNSSYDGGSVDRFGIGWYKFKIKTDNTLTLDSAQGGASGRIWDTATSNPYSFFFPSMAVNTSGDMIIGFSGSRNTEYVGAFANGRRASNGAMLGRHLLIQAGREIYDGPLNRWGDYSGTVLDSDGANFWTVQPFADEWLESGWGEGAWAVWVAHLKKGF